MEGQIVSSVSCLGCRRLSCTADRSLDLSIELATRAARPRVGRGAAHSSAAPPLQLEECLRSFFSEEQLTGADRYQCERCGGLRDARKSLRLLHLPPLLTIHLKRFSVEHGWEAGYGSYCEAQKASDELRFPLAGLSLREFCCVGSAPEASVEYDLAAVVVHHGTSPLAGHYTAYVRRGTLWYHANDANVREVSEAEVRSTEAFLLFYSRRAAVPPPSPSLPAAARSAAPGARAAWGAAGGSAAAPFRPTQSRRLHWIRRGVASCRATPPAPPCSPCSPCTPCTPDEHGSAAAFDAAATVDEPPLTPPHDTHIHFSFDCLSRTARAPCGISGRKNLHARPSSRTTAGVVAGAGAALAWPSARRKGSNKGSVVRRAPWSAGHHSWSRAGVFGRNVPHYSSPRGARRGYVSALYGCVPWHGKGDARVRPLLGDEACSDQSDSTRGLEGLGGPEGVALDEFIDEEITDVEEMPRGRRPPSGGAPRRAGPNEGHGPAGRPDAVPLSISVC